MKPGFLRRFLLTFFFLSPSSSFSLVIRVTSEMSRNFADSFKCNPLPGAMTMPRRTCTRIQSQFAEDFALDSVQA